MEVTWLGVPGQAAAGPELLLLLVNPWGKHAQGSCGSHHPTHVDVPQTLHSQSPWWSSRRIVPSLAGYGNADQKAVPGHMQSAN